MALDIVYYRVSINNMTGPNEQAGFIDHVTVQEYIDNGNGTFPASLASSENKARGNLRYIRMVNILEEVAIPLLLTQFNNAGATIDNEPTLFEFTIAYERPDYIFTYNELFGTAHPSGTIKILKNENAIKRMVARTFIDDFTSNIIYPYDPSSTNLGYQWIDKEVTAAAPVTGTLEVRITTAESNITVTQIPNT